MIRKWPALISGLCDTAISLGRRHHREPRNPKHILQANCASALRIHPHGCRLPDVSIGYDGALVAVSIGMRVNEKAAPDCSVRGLFCAE